MQRLISFFQRNKKAFISFVLFVYALSYLTVRAEHILIHRVSFMTNFDLSKSYYHKITQGDFGVPMLTGNAIWTISEICSFTFLPLGLCESLFWNIYPREYKFS